MLVGVKRYFLLLLDDHIFYIWSTIRLEGPIKGGNVLHGKHRSLEQSKLRMLQIDCGGEFDSKDFDMY
jgi:hypothetical protein